ncbi:MAG: toxin-antitoxin system HicB family antitoxin [Planctomycetota bacterium]
MKRVHEGTARGGMITIRLSPEKHGEINRLAERQMISVNQLMNDLADKALSADVSLEDDVEPAA